MGLFAPVRTAGGLLDDLHRLDTSTTALAWTRLLGAGSDSAPAPAARQLLGMAVAGETPSTFRPLHDFGP